MRKLIVITICLMLCGAAPPDPAKAGDQAEEKGLPKAVKNDTVKPDAVKTDTVKTDSKPDRELTEMLEMLEMLKEMEMMRDYHFLVEEKADETDN